MARLTLCRVPIPARRSRARDGAIRKTGTTLYKFAKLRNADNQSLSGASRNFRYIESGK
jgi:hypothetical protein